MRLFEGTPFDIPPRCERCSELEEECTCPPEPHQYLAAAKQTAKVYAEKRKRGKTVTIVAGLRKDETDLPALLTRLKTACGAGGTLKGEEIEIQGNHLTRVSELLRELEYRLR